MKLHISRVKALRIAGLALAFAVLAGPVWAQEQSAFQEHKSEPIRYAITDLGALAGATVRDATHITNRGLISGYASLPNGPWHAVLLHKGLVTDLGTPGLGGQNSVAFGVNERGQASGEAETSIPDPNGEDFCGFKALGLPSLGTTCRAFLWQDGVMTPLPTLGGPNGSGDQINNRGEVVGYAENDRTDATCPAPQLLQFKPVIWKKGQVHELPTFPGDPEGVAFYINDHGQVVGASGSCAPFNPGPQIYLSPAHALLWQEGKVTDLGNLGGTGAFGGIIANAINNRGQIVGNSDLRGDTAFHAFRWTEEERMKDLGTLPGDVNSVAVGIGEKGEIVGLSLDANFNLRAFLWQNGVMTDLNSLVGANPGKLFLQLAHSINTRGEITGFAVTSTGDTHAFLATPIRSEDGSESVASGAQDETGPSTVSRHPGDVLVAVRKRASGK